MHGADFVGRQLVQVLRASEMAQSGARLRVYCSDMSRAKETATIMHKHLREPLVPPDQINHSLSAGTCEVIEVCMAKDRAKRYNSSADLLEDLEAVQSGEAPPQARKKFDLTSLSALEPTGTVDETQTTQPLATPISQQPLLWIAVTGWIVAVILLVVISLTS